MKTIVAALCATAVQALDWELFTQQVAQADFTGALSNFADQDITEHPFYAFLHTTRADTRAIIEANPNRVKPLTKNQRRMYNNAHHNLMAQRARLGLGKVGLAAGPSVGQNYA
jgi:hypothetical protein